MNKFFRNLIMFVLGFCFYVAIEIVCRGFSFRLMGLAGGIAFVIGGNLNDKFSWKMNLLLQCLIISVVITTIEAIIGNIDYYWLHINMWSYSGLPLHFLNAKICVPFMIVWYLIGFVIVFVHDAITYYWMHEGDRPEYWIFGKRVWQMPMRKCVEE